MKVMTKVITIPKRECWDEKREMFITTPETQLELEHSLFSISKWEAIWHKPFLTDTKKTLEETISYIKCMTIGDLDDDVYMLLTQQNIDEVCDYISDSMTATTCRNTRGGSTRIYTSELLYYYMTAMNIPFECEHWHLSRLLMLIRVYNEENAASTKKSKRSDISRRYAEMNAKRKQKTGGRG